MLCIDNPRPQSALVAVLEGLALRHSLLACLVGVECGAIGRLFWGQNFHVKVLGRVSTRARNCITTSLTLKGWVITFSVRGSSDIRIPGCLWTIEIEI